MFQLDDCTLQIYKPNGRNDLSSNKHKLEADYYGSYLDLESTIDELQEEFDDFQSK